MLLTLYAVEPIADDDRANDHEDKQKGVFLLRMGDFANKAHLVTVSSGVVIGPTVTGGTCTSGGLGVGVGIGVVRGRGLGLWATVSDPCAFGGVTVVGAGLDVGRGVGL